MFIPHVHPPFDVRSSDLRPGDLTAPENGPHGPQRFDAKPRAEGLREVETFGARGTGSVLRPHTMGRGVVLGSVAGRGWISPYVWLVVAVALGLDV